MDIVIDVILLAAIGGLYWTRPTAEQIAQAILAQRIDRLSQELVTKTGREILRERLTRRKDATTPFSKPADPTR